MAEAIKVVTSTKPMIVFDGKQQQYLKLSAPYTLLKHVLDNVSGINLQKDKLSIRCTRDEMSCYLIMKHAGADVSPEVKTWLEELRDERNKLTSLFAGDITYPLDTGHDSWLYSFQANDVRYMLTAKKCINANDVGVGKTVEALAAMDEIISNGPLKVLIISPKSLMYMWADECKKATGRIAEVCDVPSQYKKHEKVNAKINSLETRIKIISYSMLDSKKWPSIYDQDWDIIICDEAHKLKNPQTKTTLEFKKLKSEYLWLLSGTPDPNGDLLEIYGMLSLIDPKRFSSKWAFLDRYGDFEEKVIGWDHKNNKPKIAKDLQGISKEMQPVLHRLLIPYMFRRKIRDVHDNIPAEVHQTIHVELGSYERRIYDEMLQDMLAYLEEENWLLAGNALERNIRLRQMLLNPVLVGGDDKSAKTEAMLELIQNIPGQVIVFSTSKAYNRYLEELFAKKKLFALRIDGDVDAATIRAREKAFQQGNAKIVHGTYAKMGEGLNLQSAQAMIRMDLSYVPKDNIQAKGRIIRPGQKHTPLIYDLVASNTIDEYVVKVNEQKENNITEIESFKYMIDELKEAYL